MLPRVLFIDDDARALEGYARVARFCASVETAPGGAEGLAALVERGPFAVVVSDMRMPAMNGAEVLARAKVISPDTTRMILTGYADMESAADAVNRGNIFRMLSKPCTPDALQAALRHGVEHHQLVVSERELRENTLRGSVKVLADILEMLHPEMFGRIGRVRDLVVALGQRMGVADQWQLSIAASLSLLGTVTIPDGILSKGFGGDRLPPKDQDLFDTHPRVAYELLTGIPRMQEVADAILYQSQRYDGNGLPFWGKRGPAIPIGGQLLKVALDFESLMARAHEKTHAISEMKSRVGWYSPEILDALAQLVIGETPPRRLFVSLHQIRPGMILADAIQKLDGTLLLNRGHTISEPMMFRLRAIAQTDGIREPIEVIIPDGVDSVAK
ncbi:HD domain-containing phosphohydrolase [Zavarzinella formosa]|uniref:HD domain-containing phosphohydrolase n=1 Tax=Zavarzinella formosa TaxID=360055 RepID=UPI0002D2AEF5|nr:HD domain-containing phosphohydrolase [Zavarzinella formosa]